MLITKVTTQQGYVTITAALIVSAILVLIISRSVLHSFLSMQSLVEIEQALKAQSRGRACVEVAWQRFMTDVGYTGLEDVEVQGGMCSITAIDSSDVRAIAITVETNEGAMVSRIRFEGDGGDTSVASATWILE